jgi:hypothetical protein
MTIPISKTKFNVVLAPLFQQYVDDWSEAKYAEELAAALETDNRFLDRVSKSGADIVQAYKSVVSGSVFSDVHS